MQAPKLEGTRILSHRQDRKLQFAIAVLAGMGAAPAAFAADVTLNNGQTETVTGAPTPVNNAFSQQWYENPGPRNDNLLGDMGAGANAGLFNVTPKGSNFRTGAIDFDNKAAYDAAAVVAANANQIGPFTGAGGVQGDDYAFLWTGTFTPTIAGDYTFGVGQTSNGVDDESVILIDFNKNGTFENATERVASTLGAGCCGSFAGTPVTIATGDTYDIAIAFHEFGGGEKSSATFLIAGDATFGSATAFDPSAANQAGWWNSSFVSPADRSADTLTVTFGSSATLDVQVPTVTFGNLVQASGSTLLVQGGEATFNTFSGDGTVALNTASNVTLAGGLGSGAMIDFTKSGAATLTLGAGSTTTAAINVTSGILASNGDGALGAGRAANGVTISDGAQLRLDATHASTSVPLSINGTGVGGGGALRATVNAAYPGAISLAGNSAIIVQDGGETLTLTGGVNNAGNEVRFGGNGNTTINTVGISGGGAVRKTEGGLLTFGAGITNSYTGATHIDGGRLLTSNASDLASSSAVNVNNSGTVLEINAAASSLGNVALTNAGAILRLSQNQAGGTAPTANIGGIVDVNASQGAGFDLGFANNSTIRAIGGARTFSGVSTIADNATLNLGGGNNTLTLSALGDTGGTGGGVSKVGTDTVILAGPNTYRGATHVAAGTLQVNSPLAATSNVTVAFGATLDARSTTALGGSGYDIGGTLKAGAANANLGNAPVSLNLGGTLQVDVGAGNTASYAGGTINANTGVIHAKSGVANLGGTAVVSTVPQFASGLLEGRLSGAFNETNANPSTALVPGPTKVQQAFANSGASGGIWVDNSTYVYNGQINIPDESDGIIGNGQGAISFGESFDDSVLVKVDGAQVLRNTTWNDTSSNGLLSLAAGWHDIELRFGQGGGGTGAVNQDNWGATDKSFGIDITDPVNNTAVSGGTAPPANFHTNFTAPVDPGDMSLFRVLSGGVRVQVDATADLRLASFTNASAVQLNAAAADGPVLRLLDAAGTSGTNQLAVAGSAGGQATVEVAGTLNVGALDAADGTNLTKTGAGRLNVNGAGAGTGSLSITAGSLGGTGIINGPVTIAAGASLAPGLSPGTLGVGGADFADGSSFVVELNGLTAGTEYDVLNVTGAVDLGAPGTGPSLSVLLGFTPNVGDAFTILQNDDVDPINGVFAEGATVSSGAYQFAINYAGGSGNDVVLTTVAVPEPASLGLLGLAGVALLGRRRRSRKE